MKIQHKDKIYHICKEKNGFTVYKWADCSFIYLGFFDTQEEAANWIQSR